MYWDQDAIFLAQRTVTVLHVTIQHLHHLEVRPNAVIDIDAPNNKQGLLDYGR